MLSFTCLTLRKNARMLNQPDLIKRVSGAVFSEMMHGQRNRFIRLKAKLAQYDTFLRVIWLHGSYRQSGKGKTRENWLPRVSVRKGLQHHADNFDIAQLIV
jgi:hypothetical protein